MKPICIGYGEFGPIFSGVKGQEAVDFLLVKGKGEVKDAFYHKNIGGIDLVWGIEGDLGYGLAKIVRKHPEALPNLALAINEGIIVDHIPDRIIMIHKESRQRTIIDLEFNYKIKTWVVTSYIPI